MSRAHPVILIAEDNLGDIGLVREALNVAYDAYELTVRRQGEQVLQHIAAIDTGSEPVPDLVLLDLNLPRVDGHELLRRLRASSSCADVPVIVITSSNSPMDRSEAERGGAQEYFRKPSDFDQFLELGPLAKSVIERAR